MYSKFVFTVVKRKWKYTSLLQMLGHMPFLALVRKSSFPLDFNHDNEDNNAYKIYSFVIFFNNYYNVYFIFILHLHIHFIFNFPQYIFRFVV